MLKAIEQSIQEVLAFSGTQVSVKTRTPMRSAKRQYEEATQSKRSDLH